MIISYSLGVNRPRAAWRRRWFEFRAPTGQLRLCFPLISARDRILGPHTHKAAEAVICGDFRSRGL